MPFDLYGYCLMSNHIHLLVRPVEGSISRIVQSLLVSHTQRYHRFHRSGGHVWQGRFRREKGVRTIYLLTERGRRVRMSACQDPYAPLPTVSSTT